MNTKVTNFAKYSKPLCWVVSIIMLFLSISVFTGDAESGATIGFLWLVGAIAFAVSAIFLSRASKSSPGDSSSAPESASGSEQENE